jgi:hypothetical protein
MFKKTTSLYDDEKALKLRESFLSKKTAFKIIFIQVI